MPSAFRARPEPIRISATAALRRLRVLRWQYGGLAAERLDLLRVLERATLARAADVLELHELLSVLHAYPDDRVVFDQVERMLHGFGARADLGRHRDSHVDTGIAGTVTFYRFQAPTARWLAGRWGQHLTLDWEEVDTERLARHLPLCALASECPGIDEPPLDGRAWLERLRGKETDATFLIRRASRLPVSASVRDRLYDELGLMVRLGPGPDTPSRTGARYRRSAFAAQLAPMRQGRPDMRAEALVPPRSTRFVSAREGSRLIDLAHESMVARSRDLHAFEFADPRDVRVIDCGGGLELACLGVQPQQRHLLEAAYGFLTLRNGVPIGYALASALLRSSEIAFNIFETFRHAEGACVYGRLLAVLRLLLGSDTFTVYPYQLGHENEEGIASGAWWFYYKLGFRPRDPVTLRVVRRELARLRRWPSYRSSPATLRLLARRNVFLSLGRDRDDVMGIYSSDAVGLAVTDYVSCRFGSDRELAERTCADEAAALLRAGSWRRFPADERLAWQRLSPVVLMLPGIAHWSLADRRALGALMRAKGSRRETTFVDLANQHPRFNRALAALARKSAIRFANPRPTRGDGGPTRSRS